MAGASGQVDIDPAFEVEEPGAMAVGEYDDRPNVSNPPAQHGPNSPSHGAAGGHEVDFWMHGASPSTPNSPVGSETGLTDAALGG